MHNIALYLKLTHYFINIISKNKDYINSNKLFRILKRYNIEDIFYILNRASIVNNNLKLFYIVFLYKLLDRKKYNELLYKSKKYKLFITLRINKIKCDLINNYRNNQRLNYGLEYINTKFEDNKRYFYKKNNRMYYKKLLSIYLKTIVYTIKWYKETLEKTYKPGGRGYFEAKNRFENRFENKITLYNSALVASPYTAYFRCLSLVSGFLIPVLIAIIKGLFL